MKTIFWIYALPLILMAAIPLHAQNTKTQSDTFFETVKTNAENGNAVAQWMLGNHYMAAKDEIEAVKWYRKSAEQGQILAQDSLALCYERGTGVKENRTEATKWRRRAANQGDQEAQLMLGYDYRLGDGVPVDNIGAYKWFNLASAQGSENAKTSLFRLQNEMTPDQIAEAQRRSAAFVPRKETPDANSNSSSPVATDSPTATGTGFFITDDGYLISNYHVVKDATKVRLLTSTGLIDAKVVQVDAANDLALLKVLCHP